jgi:hypothetical protein
VIIRILLAVFISVTSGAGYLAGFVRLISGLLVGFGALVSMFFAILFIVEPHQRELWFPVYGQGSAWPFFGLGCVLLAMTGLFFTGKREYVHAEQISSTHLLFWLGGFFATLASVFIPAFFLFPSDHLRETLGPDKLYVYTLAGTMLYLLGTTVSLYLFYRASKGTAPKYPDLMRRFVLALFSIVHFDKIPVFITFLLIYSPDSRIIYPSLAAMSLSAYIPIAWFLLKLSWQSERSHE